MGPSSELRNINLQQNQNVRLLARPASIAGQNALIAERIAVGKQQVDIDWKLGAGEGMYVPAGSLTSFLAAASTDSVYLQFMLAPQEDMGRGLTAGEDIRVEDIFASTEPLSGLAAGNYRFNLIRMQYPPGATTRPMQERTTAGLYYVVAGNGELDGAAPGRMQAGTAVLAPVDGNATWSNRSSVPLEIVFASLAPAADTVKQ